VSDNGVILELRRVVRRVEAKTIIDDLSAQFRKGRIYSVIGPSGAGKSSLLRLVNRLDEIGSGEIRFHGLDIRELPPTRLRCRIGYLFQTPYLFPGTVRDNFFSAACARTEETAARLADLVQLEAALIDADTEPLSLGQKQRVALGRLLATEPEIALLDEPTSALDPTITEAIERTVMDIVRRTGLTVIWVTHHPDQALRLGGETLLLVQGRLVESGPSDEVINRPQTDLGRRYRARELR